jgi:hypothetical protein
VTGNRYSQADRANAVVTAGMLLLALLGVVTVFYEPIAAIFAPPTAAGEAPLPPPGEERGAPTPPPPSAPPTR